jgi:hypothetical protein
MFADIVVDDGSDRPVALVEVSASVATRGEFLEFLQRLLEFPDPSLSFGLFVDLEDIRVLRRDIQNPSIPVVELKTQEVLKHYAPEFAGKASRYVSSPIFQDYLATLVEGWLRDLAYHWKSGDPPGSGALAETGLLERIENGMTRRTEVAAGGYPLS